MNQIIYVDDCLPELELKIFNDLGTKIVKRMDTQTWNVNDAMQIITDPSVILAVINNINETALMEISLLHFMCKPILITHTAIKSYPVVERVVDFVEYNASMKTLESNFIHWFKWWENS